MAGDSATKPSQQGVKGDKPAGSNGMGECGGERAEQGPVAPRELGPRVLAA